MTGLLRRLCALLALLGIYACDGINLKALTPGLSTAAEVRQRMGAPGTEWRNADGSVTWEYSRQPNGSECFMLTLGPDQVLQSIEQVITEANLARIVPGWRQEQVRRLLGKPRSVEKYPLKPEEVWDWKVGTEPTGGDRYFNVHFDNEGRVTGTSAGRPTLG